MSLLSAHSCHKSQHAWHAWYTGHSGQQIARSVGSEGARLSDGVLPWHLQCGSRPESGLIWSPTSACWPHLDVSNVPTSVQKMSQLQTWTENRKIDWKCAILPDALPQHARLSITSMCSPASSLPPSVYPWRGETLTELMLINMDWDSIASGSCCCSWFHQASSPSPTRWSKQIMLWGISRFLQQSHHAVLVINQMWCADMGADSDLQNDFVDSVFDLWSVSQELLSERLWNKKLWPSEIQNSILRINLHLYDV